MPVKYPDPFLEVRIEKVDLPLPVLGVCAGYDGGIWRSKQLANHLFQWIPFAALNQEFQLSFGPDNFVEMLEIASAHIYNTKKTASRGELGELLFHLICILNFDSVPVMCKLILKTSSNDTVKGFDGIHVMLKNDDKFELWLGESKFYLDGKEAIREAVKSVKEHIAPAFLNTEKAMVIGHIGEGIPHREKIKKLFRSQTSGDQLIKMSVFPVLIAYESGSIGSFKEICDEYIESLKLEVEVLRDYFDTRAKDLKLRFQLIFVPLGKKSDVVNNFDKKLEAFL